MESKYILGEGKLSILDEELGIEIEENFSPKTVEHNAYSIPKKSGAIYWEKRDGENNLLFSSSALDEKFHGLTTFYFSQGKLASKSWYYQGQRIGKCEKYYPQGNLYSLEYWSAKHEKMLFKSWYASGQSKTKIPYERGLAEGKVELYWENGNKKRVCMCSKGLKSGREQIFSEEGVLKEDCIFEKGTLVKVEKSVLEGINV
ncbi:hypothetical protein COB21_04945 [Candidatus Aerophobetes bacterium]|uniref:Toxin-antitoxin system YwqK family antitoxin n=1 Tax=Aerophobetes bacterium TaxID=2030807 RepID=A0A2A4X1V9_UNCAE|nr:MAG: hypothetical protein COB21_04945 [Candidatus Aerophobetes bacterium]